MSFGKTSITFFSDKNKYKLLNKHVPFMKKKMYIEIFHTLYAFSLFC